MKEENKQAIGGAILVTLWIATFIFLIYYNFYYS